MAASTPACIKGTPPDLPLSLSLSCMQQPLRVLATSEVAGTGGMTFPIPFLIDGSLALFGLNGFLKNKPAQISPSGLMM